MAENEPISWPWTATVKATLAKPFFADIQLFERLGGELPRRAPVFKLRADEANALRIAFGVEGNSKDEAAITSEELVVKALGVTSLTASQVECVSVVSNEALRQDIERIQSDGTMRPGAQTFTFESKKGEI